MQCTTNNILSEPEHFCSIAPTVVTAEGDQRWYVDGKLHCDTGPAIKKHNGDRLWYKHGQVHRDAGPAAEYHNGNHAWYCNGELHRVGGPAIIWDGKWDGSNVIAWYLHNRNYSCIHAYCDAAGITGVDRTIFILKWCD